MCIRDRTGTAQANYHKIRATEIHHVASFVGYFPAENPVYSCIIVIDDPKKGSIYGGEVAGPVFRKIADRCFETQTAFYDSMQQPQSISNNITSLRTQDLPDNDIGYRKDFELILAHLNLQHRPPTQEVWSVTEAETDSVSLQKRTVPTKQVPNVVGMGWRDAIYLLENRRIYV